MVGVPRQACTLTLRDGGSGVGGVRQLVGGQRGHASGREAPRQKVVERCQLVGSCLLTPAGTAVTEPDLGGAERRVESPQPGSEWRAEPQLEPVAKPSPSVRPGSSSVGGDPQLPAALESGQSPPVGVIPACPHHQRGEYHCYPHFTDEQTAMQRQQGTRPRDRVSRMRSQVREDSGCSVPSTVAAPVLKDIRGGPPSF